MKVASAILTTFIVMPIWYFILYTLLSVAHVDRLVWFLFWIYIPFGISVMIIDKAITKK